MKLIELPRLEFILTNSLEPTQWSNRSMKSKVCVDNEMNHSTVCVFAYFMESALSFKRELCKYLQSINNICSVSFAPVSLLVSLLSLLLLPICNIENHMPLYNCTFNYILRHLCLTVIVPKWQIRLDRRQLWGHKHDFIVTVLQFF